LRVTLRWRQTAIATSTMHYDKYTSSTSQPFGADDQRPGDPGTDDFPTVSVAALMVENAGLRSELASVHLERTKLAETQQRIMELLHVDSPDRLVHDIRNVLNERSLLKALIEMTG
jgi:hypothetical protein